MVEAATSAVMEVQGRYLENVAGGVDCYSMRQPLGVCAGIVTWKMAVGSCTLPKLYTLFYE